MFEPAVGEVRGKPLVDADFASLAGLRKLIMTGAEGITDRACT